MAAAKKKPTATTEKATEAAAIVVNLQDLQTIVNAGSEGLFTPKSVHEPLAAAGLVEVNAAFVDDQGMIATRATAAGVAKCKPSGEPASVIKLETGIPVPEVATRGRNSGTTLPFDQMEVGHSFFVAATEKKPNPAKSLASTVSRVTKSYAYPDQRGETKVNRKGKIVPVMIKTREFIVKEVEGGARVWRTK